MVMSVKCRGDIYLESQMYSGFDVKIAVSRLQNW